MWFYVLDLVSFLHWALKGPSPARRSRGFVPSAECFEDRCVPCATGFGGDTVLMSAIPVEQVSQAPRDEATYKPTESLSIQVSAIPVEQMSDARVLVDGGDKPTESLSVQDSGRGGDAGTLLSFHWGVKSLDVGGLAEDHVEGSLDDPGAIYGFNPQPDPPVVARDLDMLAIDSMASEVSSWSWGENG